jgi:hypothetical protein
MKEKFNEQEYKNKYNQENYVSRSIRLKKEENDKLNQILENKKIGLKNYILEKIEKDIKNIK